MANSGHNEGFHVLEDSVCDAIHDPALPRANPANQGHNEGMAVGTEVVCDPSSTRESGAPDNTPPQPITGNNNLIAAAAGAAFGTLTGGVLRLIRAIAGGKH